MAVNPYLKVSILVGFRERMEFVVFLGRFNNERIPNFFLRNNLPLPWPHPLKYLQPIFLIHLLHPTLDIELGFDPNIYTKQVD